MLFVNFIPRYFFCRRLILCFELFRNSLILFVTLKNKFHTLLCMCVLCHLYVGFRSASLACHTMTQRVSLASPMLSVTVEDSSDGSNVTSSSAASGLPSFLSLSREKKLTVINFCTTNLCVGCFYSLLGPFFPTEVC